MPSPPILEERHRNGNDTPWLTPSVKADQKVWVRLDGRGAMEANSKKQRFRKGRSATFSIDGFNITIGRSSQGNQSKKRGCARTGRPVLWRERQGAVRRSVTMVTSLNTFVPLCKLPHEPLPLKLALTCNYGNSRTSDWGCTLAAEIIPLPWQTEQIWKFWLLQKSHQTQELNCSQWAMTMIRAGGSADPCFMFKRKFLFLILFYFFSLTATE